MMRSCSSIWAFCSHLLNFDRIELRELGPPREEVVIWAIHLFLDAWTGGEGIREP